MANKYFFKLKLCCEQMTATCMNLLNPPRPSIKDKSGRRQGRLVGDVFAYLQARARPFEISAMPVIRIFRILGKFGNAKDNKSVSRPLATEKKTTHPQTKKTVVIDEETTLEKVIKKEFCFAFCE